MFSFLSSAIPAWPLSALSASTFSSTLQRQVLRYILKRALGRLIKDGDIQLDQIEAGLGTGVVEVRNVHLDVDSINAMMRGTHLRIEYGLVGLISIRIPWSNLREGDITINVANIDAQFSLKNDRDVSFAETLGESILSATEDVFEDDEEGRELEASIASIVDEGQGVGQPSIQQTLSDFIARQLSGIVARTNVLMSNMIFKLKSGSDSAGKDIELQVRCDRIGVTPISAENDVQIARQIAVDGVSVWIDNQSDKDQDGQDSSSSGSEEDFGGLQASHADLQMSAATSMYASAQDLASIDEAGSSRSGVNTLESGPQLIAKMVGEPLQIDLTSSMPQAQENVHSTARPTSSVQQFSIRVLCGPIALLLTPNTTMNLFRFAQDASSAFRPRESSQDAVRKDAADAQTSFALALTSKDLQLVCLYDSPLDLDGQAYASYRQSCDSFWSRPNRHSPSLGHFRLRSQDLTMNAGFDRNSSFFNVHVGDAGLYEYVSPRSIKRAEHTQLVPMIVFDENITTATQVSQDDAANLHKEDGKSNRLGESSVVATDWRRSYVPVGDKGKVSSPYRRTDFSDQGWKVKTGHRRSSSSPTATSSPALRKSCVFVSSRTGHGSKKREPTDVKIIPFHVFVDTSVVDRVLPFVDLLGRGMQSTTETGQNLSASISSFETVHASRFGEDRCGGPIESSWHPMRITCPLIRIELRVHTRLTLEVEGGVINETEEDRSSGFSTRSGLLVIDLCDIELSNSFKQLSHPAVATHAVHFDVPDDNGPSRNYRFDGDGDTTSSVHLSFSKIQLFYGDCKETQARLFAVIGALKSEDEAEASVVPTLTYTIRQSVEETKQTFADCRLPQAEVELSKALLDGLELMADDFSLWTNNLREWHNRLDAEHAADALRILGSRFFGTRQSYSTLSSSSTSTEVARQPQSMPVFTLSLHEASVLLQLTHANGISDAIRVSASGFDVRVDGHYGPNSTRASLLLSILTIHRERKRKAEEDSTNVILERTIRSPLQGTARPMISVHITTTIDPETSFRGSQIDVLLQNGTLTYDGDDGLLRELLAFSRSPEGAFEHVEPNEVTRIVLRIKDASFLLAPTKAAARLVCLFDDVSVRTKLVSDFPRTGVRLSLGEASLFYGETMEVELEKEVRTRRASELWTGRRLSKLSNVKGARALVTLSTLTRPEVDIKLTMLKLEVLACADTMKVVQDLVESIKPAAPAPASVKQRTGRMKSESPNLHVSVDEDAFRRARTVGSIPDLLEDDIPSHPIFLQGTENKSRVDDRFEFDDMLSDDDEDEEGEEASPHSAKKNVEEAKSRLVLQDDVVAIRLLDIDRGISPTPNFFTQPNLSVPMPGERSKKLASSVRFTLQDCDFTLRLFGGYDAASTRSAIEEEAKRVRRRLQKIKQMLDQGQTPDDSVEEATASLLDSVHFTLPNGVAASEMDAGAMMQLVDEEMDDQSETASSASTWKQFVPGRVSSPGADTLASSTRTRQKRSKLARSRFSMIDVEVKGIQLEYDAFEPGNDLASSITSRIESVRILDHVPTSTWQTFLTGMASQTSNFARAEEMIRFEILNVCPTKTADTVEVRCKARIAPIRLHVDQDALDFLKKFFMFEIPSKTPMQTKTSDTDAPGRSEDFGPFIQHAEVFAIKLKLDYKPKRVDYRLLRQGKTIEMMNFFSFEGSEITLRHITLRGILGWPKLFDLLNDLWTPDVKANQLADVLSGITPIRSLVNVGNGMADLILLPIEQYQRDGRLSKGLREGAKRFVKTTALEAARIGARLATGTQVILEQAEHVLGGTRLEQQSGVVTDASRSGRWDDEDDEGDEEFQDEREKRIAPSSSSKPATLSRISRYANQPAGIRQALDEAQQGLTRGFNEAAQTILAVPMEMYDRQSGEGGDRPVIRAVPIAVLQSAAGATEAISKTLQGIQRELAGARLAEDEEQEEKYKKGNR